MLAALLLLVSLLDAPRIQVIDLDGGEPRHLIVIIDGEPTKVISIPAGSGPVPPPIPTPTPTPTPKPTPITGALWVTYIVPDQPSVDDAAVTTHAPLRARIDGKEINWRMQAAKDQEIERRHFGPIVAAGVPVAIFQDSAGKVLKTVRGNDPAAILDTITQFKGER